MPITRPSIPPNLNFFQKKMKKVTKTFGGIK